MSTSGYRRGPVCGVDNCPSRLWRTINGQMVCQYGHVNEYALEFNDEEENMESLASGRMTRRLNNVVGLSQTTTRHKFTQQMMDNAEIGFLYGSELNVLMLRSMQIILSKQARAVIGLYQVDADLYTSYVKLYWSRLLAESYRGQVSAGFKLPIRVPDLLQICYVALCKVTTLAYLTDFLNAANLEQIPCHKVVNCLPASIFRRIPPTSHRTFALNLNTRGKFYRYKGVDRFIKHDSELAQVKLDYLPFLVRLVLEMYLPFEIINLVSAIISQASVSMRLNREELHPELKVIGILIVAVRVFFGRSPDIYAKWLFLYTKHKNDPERFNTLADPVHVQAEIQFHSKPKDIFHWDQYKMDQVAKLYQKYYFPSSSNENISSFAKGSGAQRMLVRGLNTIFSLDREMETHSDEDRALQKYKEHFSRIYTQLYSKSEENHDYKISTATLASFQLVDILVDHYRDDTGLLYKDFEPIIGYGEQMVALCDKQEVPDREA